MNTRITVIANQKGGVGKTTTAHALANGLNQEGHKALAVDTDPQGNLSFTMRADPDAPGAYEIMKGLVPVRDAIQRTGQGDIIGASLMLSGADMEFTSTGREYMLAKLLRPLHDAYSHIIIDSPPTLGILTINALTAAHDIVIPLGADAYSLQGLAQLYSTIERVREYCNPALEIAGLLITRHSGRTVLGRDLKAAIEEKAHYVGAKAYDTVIRESVAIREAQVQRSSLYAADPENNAVRDYLAFTGEYLMKGARWHG